MELVALRFHLAQLAMRLSYRKLKQSSTQGESIIHWVAAFRQKVMNLLVGSDFRRLPHVLPCSVDPRRSIEVTGSSTMRFPCRLVITETRRFGVRLFRGTLSRRSSRTEGLYTRKGVFASCGHFPQRDQTRKRVASEVRRRNQASPLSLRTPSPTSALEEVTAPINSLTSRPRNCPSPSTATTRSHCSVRPSRHALMVEGPWPQFESLTAQETGRPSSKQRWSSRTVSSVE